MIKLVYLVGGQILIGIVRDNVLHHPYELLATPNGTGLNVTFMAYGSFFGALNSVESIPLEANYIVTDNIPTGVKDAFKDILNKNHINPTEL